MTGVVAIDPGRHSAAVRFSYSRAAVDVIRRAPRRQWDQTARCWWVPDEDVSTVAAMFDHAGFTVYVSGVVWQAPVVLLRANGDPLVTVLRSVPESLRAGTIRALAKVWHPDVAGDGDLMRRLNAAVEQLPGGRRKAKGA